MKTSSKSIAFIHLLRAIAPLIVVESHLAGWWLLERGESSAAFEAFSNLIIRPLHLYQNGGLLGVVVFFLVSGFIISHVAEQETRAQFAIKRLFRIFPAMWFAILLMAGAAFVSSQLGYGKILGNNAVGVSQYLLTATLADHYLLNPNGALSVTWSLIPEFLFYALSFAMLPLMGRRPVVATLTMTGVAAASLLPHIFWPAAARGMAYLPMMVIGRCFYLNYSKQAASPLTHGIAALNFGLFCLIYVVKYGAPSLFEAPYEPFFTYVEAILIFYGAMALKIERLPRPIWFLGDISYSLYLVHLPVGMLALDVMADWPLPFTARFILAAGLSIAVAATVHYLIEKPMQNVGRRIADAPTSAVTIQPSQLQPGQ